MESSSDASLACGEGLRRLYAVGIEKFSILEEAIEHTKNDEEGNKFHSKKLTVATSLVSEQKDMKRKVAKRQQLKYVASEKQVGFELSQGKQRNREVQNERAAKAPVTINGIGTVRSIFIFEQREDSIHNCGGHDAERCWGGEKEMQGRRRALL